MGKYPSWRCGGDCADQIGGGIRDGTELGGPRSPQSGTSPSSPQGGPGTTSRCCGHSNAVGLRCLFCLQLSISVPIVRLHRLVPFLSRGSCHWSSSTLRCTSTALAPPWSPSFASYSPLLTAAVVDAADMAGIPCVVAADSACRPGHPSPQLGCPGRSQGCSGCSHKRHDFPSMAGS